MKGFRGETQRKKPLEISQGKFESSIKMNINYIGRCDLYCSVAGYGPITESGKHYNGLRV